MTKEDCHICGNPRAMYKCSKCFKWTCYNDLRGYIGEHECKKCYKGDEE